MEPSTQCSFPSSNDEVVGFVKDAESIVKKLTQGTKKLDVISIIGMAGLGKTTLARKVYNNPSVVNHFDVKVWCTVSQTYNASTLLLEILKKTTPSEIKKDDDIADKLQKSLKGRRYLIVLDDMWEVEAWKNLGFCFPTNENGSRVIVTTRIEEVAEYLQYHSDPYALRFLTPEESWELLQKKVFQGESCPTDLLEVGQKVAQPCKGLPLVIVLIAGIIGKLERQASLWLEVANDLSSYVLEEQTMMAIQSSYDHLEDHLKPCLLYMALYPEDYKIPVSDLLKLWMAEEFVLNIDTENMEETSRIFLNDLLNRSVVMVSKRRLNGDIEHCVLHDVVREFCLNKLTKEKFMQLTVPYNPYKHLQYSKESQSCIYIHDDLVEQLDHSEYQLDKIPMLESKEAMCSGGCPTPLEFIAHPTFNTWGRSNPLPLLVKLRSVRALHLLDVKLPGSWVNAVQLLTHLRYLGIYVDEFKFMWISHLQDLQTLVVNSRESLSPWVADLWEMKKLRHVNIGNFYFLWTKKERKIYEKSSEIMLENMKTFGKCSIKVDERNPRFWWRYPNLEELSLLMKDVPFCSLFPVPEVHTRLHSLELEASSKVDPLGSSAGWGRYFVFPSNLRDLCIDEVWLTEETILPKIAQLRKLENLKLISAAGYRGDRSCWNVSYVEFPALKYLTLEKMKMEEWNASDESFPTLEKLVIHSCRMLKEIPPSFVDIPTLQLIQLSDCPYFLKDSAMNIKREIEENTGCDRLQVHLPMHYY